MLKKQAYLSKASLAKLGYSWIMMDILTKLTQKLKMAEILTGSVEIIGGINSIIAEPELELMELTLFSGVGNITTLF